MKISAYLRFSLSLTLICCFLAPTATLAAGDGKKHFNDGITYETAEQWDKAVEEFALAVSEKPKNSEYRLHYQRALFNASQMYMKRGNSLAEQKDYAGAYVAYRKAYAYDPVNELAKSEMDKMLRLQQEQDALNGNRTNVSGVKLVPTNYAPQVPDITSPRLEKLRDVPFPGGVDLQFLVRELAKDLDLNVLFDTESRLETRKVKIELKGVTSAKALDYIFLQEGLFFQKVGPRTIVVATQLRRQNYQQLVLRTFYLANADPIEVAKVIQSAIPAQPGRTPTIPLVDKATNSLTIRDTAENIQIIGKLINSLDKDRAEVVMDVNIYEVSKQDLLKLGNQIGSDGQLSNLGSFGLPFFRSGANNGSLTSNLPFKALDVASIAIGLPTSTISAFQNKSNTRLLASTQVHAFNGEKSSAKIGQRVPVRSASISNGGGINPGGGGTNNFVSDVITYEQTGLELEFEPLVFPNQDVQVKMSITSRDLAGSGVNGNPIFGERVIKGSARIQNNRTMMLASVAQSREQRGRAGLPLLGLIPIIGRLFATPTKDDSQVDIVIAVTPRVLRAPSILPEDEIERPTGSLAQPTSSSLEAMIFTEDREEQLAAARRLTNTANVQLPDQKLEVPQYVKSDAGTTVNPAAAAQATTATPDAQTVEPKTDAKTAETSAILKPIDTSVKTLSITETSDTTGKIELKQTALTADAKTEPAETKAETKVDPNLPKAEFKLISALPELKAGEKAKVAVMVKTALPFRSAVLGLNFDPAKVAVRGVTFGDVFGAQMAQTAATPFLNQNGKMFVSLSTEKDVAVTTSGILAYIEIEALAAGVPTLSFNSDVLNLLTTDGKSFDLKY